MDTNGNNNNNNKSIKRKVVNKLIEGYKFATQLQLLLSHQHSNSHQIYETRVVSGDPDPVQELLDKILGSFHETISVLDFLDPVTVSIPVALEGSRNASCGEDSAAPVSCSGGDSGDSRKRLGVGKGKRGCYTRKKKSHTRIVEARTTEDFYAWRKYGQKDILNTKFPRSYFRCTHKPIQGCKAAKQVQKMKQDPELYQITYIGYHTCTASDQTHAKTEPFNQEVIMDIEDTLATTTSKNHVHVQEQENNISSVTEGMVKDEEISNGENKEFYGEGSSTEDLSLVWQEDMLMFDDQNQYCYGETRNTSHHFSFIDNDQFSPFYDSYSAYR